MRASLLFGAFVAGTISVSAAASVYPLRLDDAKAVYLTADQFRVPGDVPQWSTWRDRREPTALH